MKQNTEKLQFSFWKSSNYRRLKETNFKELHDYLHQFCAVSLFVNETAFDVFF